MKKILSGITAILLACLFAGCTGEEKVALYDDLEFGMSQQEIIANQGIDPNSSEEVYGTLSTVYSNKDIYGYSGDLVLEIEDDKLYRIILQAKDTNYDDYEAIKKVVTEKYPVQEMIDKDTQITLGNNSTITKYTYVHGNYEVSISNQEDSSSVNIIFTEK